MKVKYPKPPEPAKPKTPPEQYVGIMLWGQLMGSFDYYIKDRQQDASNSYAPIDAIFQNFTPRGWDGTWATVSTLHPTHSFRDIYNAAFTPKARKKK